MTFRLIVFRPFKGEVLTGRISSSTPAGIKVRLDFFEDILIPGHLLFDDCALYLPPLPPLLPVPPPPSQNKIAYPTPPSPLNSDIKENVWVWHNDGTELYMDKGETIRFKVENEKFTDQTPISPVAAGVKVEMTPVGATEEEAAAQAGREQAEMHKDPPYQINVSGVFLMGRGAGLLGILMLTE